MNGVGDEDESYHQINLDLVVHTFNFNHFIQSHIAQFGVHPFLEQGVDQEVDDVGSDDVGEHAEYDSVEVAEDVACEGHDLSVHRDV